MNWLLIVVILVLAWFIVQGHKKGLLKVVFALVSWLIVIAVVSWSARYISDFLTNHTSLPQKIEANCEEHIRESVREKMLEQNSKLEDIHQFEGMQIGTDEEIRELGILLPAFLLDKLLQDTGTYDKLAWDMAGLAINGLSYIFAFLIAMAVCYFLAEAISLVNHIPIIGGINRRLGGVAGAAEGLIIVWVLFAIAATFAGTKGGGFILTYIYEAPILTWLYENNMVLRFFVMWL